MTINQTALQTYQREIARLRRELAVKEAIITRLTQLPSLLPPAPLERKLHAD